MNCLICGKYAGENAHATCVVKLKNNHAKAEEGLEIIASHPEGENKSAVYMKATAREYFKDKETGE